MGGRTVKKPSVKFPRKTFKWTPEMRIGMAEYVRAKYDYYKKALGSQRKIEFLRTMRDVLEITADDKQLRNGFQFMMFKYEDVKRKLNSSGFGIDPEKDKSLDTGWILKVCPYFDALDEVMGTRPNVRPPAIVSTSLVDVLPGNAFENVPVSMEEDEELLDITDQVEDESPEVNDTTIGGNPSEMEGHADGNVDTEPNQGEKVSEESASMTDKYVRQALHGIKNKKDSLSMKTPLGVFSKVMSQKIEENVQAEREKMKIQANHHEEDRKIQKEKNDIEKLKVQSQIDLEQRRLDIEEKRLEERKEERQHEMDKLKMEQEFQLQKLKLQLELQNK